MVVNQHSFFIGRSLAIVTIGKPKGRASEALSFSKDGLDLSGAASLLVGNKKLVKP